MFGLRDAGFSFDIDENEIVMAGPEHGEGFGVTKGGVDVKAREGENAVAKGTDGFAGADVQDCAFVIRSGICHCCWAVSHGLR